MKFSEVLAYPLRSGVSVPASKRGSGIRMVNMRELFGHRRLGDVEMARVDIGDADEDRYLLGVGDLLFARRSLTLEGAGQCSIVIDVDEPTTWESSILRARVDSSVFDPYFLYYYFRSPLGRFALSSIANQVAAAGIKASDLAKIELPVVPLEIQRNVARMLGALDDKVAANRRAAAIVADLQRALWAAASADLATVQLVMVASPHLGGTPARTDADAWSGSVRWASVRDLTAADGGILMSTAETISLEASRGARRLRELPEGTVVLTARGTVGHVAVLGVPAVINQSAYAFVPERGRGVALRLGIESLADSLKKQAHGSVFSTITMGTLKEAMVPDFFSGAGERSMQALESLEGLRVGAMSENIRLAATRDELLPLLMSGKITVKDAEKTVEGVL